MANDNTQQPDDQLQDLQKLREMIRGIQYAMLTTHDVRGHLHSRPMATQQTEVDGVLWFLTRDTTAKAGEIAQDHRVNVSFSDPDDHRYVSISGMAELIHDKSRIQELWNPMFKAWFPKGSDDPEIALIRVTIEDAEYWDSSSSRMSRLFGMARAIVTGQEMKPGEAGQHGRLDMTG